MTDDETVPPPAPPSRQRQPLVIVFFTLLAVVVVYSAGKILAPFATPILLAVVVVVLTFRIFAKVRARLGGRENLAATVMLLLITFTLVLPAFVLAVMLIQQANALFEVLQHADYGAISRWIRLDQRLAFIKDYFPGFDPASLKLDQMVFGAVKQIPGIVALQGGRALAGVANLLIAFIFMLMGAFYFYTTGEKLVRELRFLSPLPDEYDTELFTKFRDVIDATFRGQIMTALAQGAVTALGLAIARVPGAFFWGAVAAVFSLLPMVGAAVIWIPAAGYLLIQSAVHGSSWWPGIFMVLWGIVVVSMVDNIIRPWAMKGKTEMSAVLLFVSVFGGVKAFGFVGILLGPLVFAMFTTVVHMYKVFFADSLRRQNAL